MDNDQPTKPPSDDDIDARDIDPAERRTDERAVVDFWVEEESRAGSKSRHTGNLSAGGIYLDHALPKPIGTHLVIRFRLPGSDLPVRVLVEVVGLEASHQRGLGLHLKFLDLDPGVREKIEILVGSD